MPTASGAGTRKPARSRVSETLKVCASWWGGRRQDKSHRLLQDEWCWREEQRTRRRQLQRWRLGTAEGSSAVSACASLWWYSPLRPHFAAALGRSSPRSIFHQDLQMHRSARRAEGEGRTGAREGRGGWSVALQPGDASESLPKFVDSFPRVGQSERIMQVVVCMILTGKEVIERARM